MLSLVSFPFEGMTLNKRAILRIGMLNGCPKALPRVPYGHRKLGDDSWICCCRAAHIFISTLFGGIEIASIRLTVTLSPKPLDKIQPNLVCELLTWIECAIAKHNLAWGPGPWGGQIGLSVRLSVTLSPPKPLDKIQTNYVCELLT